MKTIDNYIYEKLTLNSQSKLAKSRPTYKTNSDKFKVNITNNCWVTKKCIGQIIEYFENVDILPEEITNYHRGSYWSSPNYTGNLYVYWKGPKKEPIYLVFTRNPANKFRIYTQWRDTGHEGYPNGYYDDTYVTFDKIMKTYVPQALELPAFIKQIKNYQN